MANKAAKQLAQRNVALLQRMHIASLCIHLFYILIRLVIFRSRTSSRTYLAYILLSSPSLIIQFYLEKLARPNYNAQTGDLVSGGQDLEARGLTEYMFDLMYWTWGTIALAAILGDRTFWLMLVVPVYSLWAAWRAFGGMKESLGALANAGKEEAGPNSKRQTKMEKRGAKTVYR